MQQKNNDKFYKEGKVVKAVKEPHVSQKIDRVA